jgi:pimeloyl-ACP methyl ester carboxylesterase
VATRDRKIETPDGRVLGVHEGGDLGGVPVVYHHGTPASGVLWSEHVSLAEEQGIRLIGYDRPGYGESTPAPDRVVADAARDVEAIADALGLERFASWGISGGGPHVLACAALCDDRLAACAALAAVAPYDADGLHWLAGMGEGNVHEFTTVLEGRDALTPLLEGEALVLTGADLGRVMDGMSTLLSPPDREVMRDGIGAFMVEGARAGMEHGVEGWVEDDLAFVQPWGFEVEEIARPVLVLQGRQDLMVPYAHGEWLAARIPGAEARLADDEGHLTLLARRVRDVHEWLLARI